MRFHYAKYLILVLSIVLLVWLSSVLLVPLSIDPLTLARSHNRQITEYLNEAKTQLQNGNSSSGTSVPKWLRDASEHVLAAQVVVSDQAKALEELSKKDTGLDLGSMQTALVSIITFVGTLSTVILSWRKDVREAQAELEKIKAQIPKIYLK